MTDWPVRPATDAELPAVAAVWTDAWTESHAPHVPPALLRQRGPAQFETRVRAMGDGLRVAGPEGAPLGFCAVREDELYQLFLRRDARGTGLAARLLADGEARLAAAGIREGWLHCLPENPVARRFYAREGWIEDAAPEEALVDTVEGPFRMRLLRLRKRLCPGRSGEGDPRS